MNGLTQPIDSPIHNLIFITREDLDKLELTLKQSKASIDLAINCIDKTKVFWRDLRQIGTPKEIILKLVILINQWQNILKDCGFTWEVDPAAKIRAVEFLSKIGVDAKDYLEWNK